MSDDMTLLREIMTYDAKYSLTATRISSRQTEEGRWQGKQFIPRLTGRGRFRIRRTSGKSECAYMASDIVSLRPA